MLKRRLKKIDNAMSFEPTNTKLNSFKSQAETLAIHHEPRVPSQDLASEVDGNQVGKYEKCDPFLASAPASG